MDAFLQSDAWDDDEPPFVGPEVQAEYEALLGTFLVKFNRVENLLTTLFSFILDRLERPDIYEALKGEMLARKLQHLELLSLTEVGARTLSIPFDKVRSLNGSRNVVAHGHFEQNPFSGAFKIVGTDRARVVTSTDLKAYSRLADEIWDELRGSEARLWFDEATSGM